MTLAQFNRLAACRYGKLFLRKSYSLELMVYLLEYEVAEGVEDLLSSLNSHTPKFPAFLSYLALLEEKGCIVKVEGVAKKSRKIIALADDCRACISECLELT